MANHADRLLAIEIVVAREVEEPAVALMETVYGASPTVYALDGAPEVTLTVYLEGITGSPEKPIEAVKAGMEQLRDLGLETGPCTIHTHLLEKEDWAESWKRHFKSIHIGSSLLVKPEWDATRPVSGQQTVILNPGLSFGTGQHPTTRFCLKQLAWFHKINPGRSFLDIGTGSGVLAIAAGKLGYHPIEAIDHDPQAVETARDNTELNVVTHAIRFTCVDLARWNPDGSQFDLVCANLISDLLIRQHDQIAGFVAGGGRLVLAGILDTEFAAVDRTYSELGFRRVNAETQGEWQSGAFDRV